MDSLHEGISGTEAFFKQTVRPVVITEQTDKPEIPGHDNKHITILGLTVQLLVDNGQDTYNAYRENHGGSKRRRSA